MSSPAVKVLILGYGEMGHAMQKLLEGHADVQIWEKFPAPGMASADLEDAAPAADIVLFCLPMSPHRVVASQIAPLLKPGSICVSIAKGLDESGQSAAQVFTELFSAGASDYAVLYGPMIAEELIIGRPGFAQLACSSQPAAERVQSLFSHTLLIVTPCDDMAGISWAVILKNVYAIVFGIADELQLGDNVRGFLMTAAVAELGSISASLGGSDETACGLAGLGDLVTTATSDHSHHHELGRRLARCETGQIAGEGVHTLAMVEQHALFKWEGYPLFSLIRDLVRQPQSAERDLLEFAKG